jgi:hypothetical protein
MNDRKANRPLRKLGHQNVLLGLVIGLGLSEIQSIAIDLTKFAEPAWPSKPLRIDLSGRKESLAQIEFSTNSAYICVSDFPQPALGDLEKVPLKSTVFDLSGRHVADATNASGGLSPSFQHQFPKTGARLMFPEFCRNSPQRNVAFWSFSRDSSLGTRFVNPGESPLIPGAVELWKLSPDRERLWATALPDSGSQAGVLGFFAENGTNYILAALAASKAFILRQSDGLIVDHFSYQHPEDGPPASGVAKNHRQKPDEGSPDFAGIFAFDPALRLLSCGASGSPRVLVLSASWPQRIVFSANDQQHPRRPFGGEWSVARLDFYSHRYLVVVSDFGGRLTAKTYNPIQIFDATNWQLVWFANSKHFNALLSPVISPDGKLLALVRDSQLEIGEFDPTSR